MDLDFDDGVDVDFEEGTGTGGEGGGVNRGDRLLSASISRSRISISIEGGELE